MKKTVLLILSAVILCAACAAQAEEAPAFTSIRQALDSTQGYAEVLDREDCVILLLEKDGRYFRLVTLTDDHAKDLFNADGTEEHLPGTMEAFNEHAWNLPLSYAEELPEAPKDEAELEKLNGKTVQDLINDEGFRDEVNLPEDEVADPKTVRLECGFYRYEFEVADAADDPHHITVRNGKFYGFSRYATETAIEKILSTGGN